MDTGQLAGHNTSIGSIHEEVAAAAAVVVVVVVAAVVVVVAVVVAVVVVATLAEVHTQTLRNAQPSRLKG